MSGLSSTVRPERQVLFAGGGGYDGRRFAARVHDLAREIVHDLRVVPDLRDVGRAQQLCFSIAQSGADLIAHAGRVEVALPCRLLGDHEHERARTAGAHDAYQKLVALAKPAAPERPELAEAKAFLTN